MRTTRPRSIGTRRPCRRPPSLRSAARRVAICCFWISRKKNAGRSSLRCSLIIARGCPRPAQSRPGREPVPRDIATGPWAPRARRWPSQPERREPSRARAPGQDDHQGGCGPEDRERHRRPQDEPQCDAHAGCGAATAMPASASAANAVPAIAPAAASRGRRGRRRERARRAGSGARPRGQSEKASMVSAP